MITCPQCSTQNQAGAAFCDNCGASLTGARPAAAAPAAPVAAPAAAGGMPCPACGAAVIPGQAFCDNCGAAISAAPPVVQPVPPPAPAPTPIAPAPAAAPAAGMVKCAACGQLSPAGQAFCDNCGASLVGPAVPPPPAMRPRLVVTATGAQFDLTGKSQAIIGREDPVSGIFPDVDLTPHGGDAGGVSRRHAKLAFNGFQWTVEDMNSTNFTFVNNQKLNPGVPQPLNHGDQVRLGKVVLTFQTM